MNTDTIQWAPRTGAGIDTTPDDESVAAEVRSYSLRNGCSGDCMDGSRDCTCGAAMAIVACGEADDMHLSFPGFIKAAALTIGGVYLANFLGWL